MRLEIVKVWLTASKTRPNRQIFLIVSSYCKLLKNYISTTLVLMTLIFILSFFL